MAAPTELRLMSSQIKLELFSELDPQHSNFLHHYPNLGIAKPGSQMPSFMTSNSRKSLSRPMPLPRIKHLDGSSEKSGGLVISFKQFDLEKRY